MSCGDYVKVIRISWEPSVGTNGGLWLFFIALLVGVAAMASGPGPSVPVVRAARVAPVIIPPRPVPQAVRCLRKRGPGWCWGVFETDRGFVPNPWARRCIRHPSETMGWCWNVYRSDL